VKELTKKQNALAEIIGLPETYGWQDQFLGRGQNTLSKTSVEDPSIFIDLLTRKYGPASDEAKEYFELYKTLG
jgi:hypothetical protein